MVGRGSGEEIQDRESGEVYKKTDREKNYGLG